MKRTDTYRYAAVLVALVGIVAVPDRAWWFVAIEYAFLLGLAVRR